MRATKDKVYSQRVTAQRLQKASERLGRPIPRLSLDEVQWTCRKLDEAWDHEKRKLLRPLRPKEILFVRNETLNCQYDFSYWFSTYHRVPHWNGASIVRPDLAIPQKIMLDVWAETEERRAAIAVIQLKARQLYVSTFIEAAVCHRVQFWPNVNATIASSDPDKSRKMARMMELSWELQPFWLVPPMTLHRVGEFIEFGLQNSGVSIQHGNQFSGISRGSTPSVAHLSEIPDFDSPENLIDAGLIKAMHPTPWMFLVLEATAAGIHDWWNNTWEQAKENWPRGKSLLRPLFLPWFVGTDIYPTEADLREHPIPPCWSPAPITEKHAERARDYVTKNDLLRKYLGADWIMPRAQMWYWEWQYEQHKGKKILAQFLQEMPADDNEAFQSAHTSVFDVDIIQAYREKVKQPWGVFAVEGEEIPERLRPARRDVDLNRKPIEITCRWNPSIPGQSFRLLPLKWQGYYEDDGLAKLYVWEPPRPGEHYGLGVDTSEGIGLDRSVIEVCRKGRLGHTTDAQVAEYTNPKAGPVDLWPICMAIGTWYSTLVFDQIRQAKMVIERFHEGDVTQLELRKRGWTHFHHWLKIDNKKLQPSRAQKIGWCTNAWSRPQMMAWLIKALRDEWLEINSPWFINEMRDIERDESKAMLKAVYGGHDDRFMALGIVFYSLWYLELRGGGSQTELAIERMRERTAGGDPILYLAGPGEKAPEFDSLQEAMPWETVTTAFDSDESAWG